MRSGLSSAFDKWIGRLKYIEGEFGFLKTVGSVHYLRNEEGNLHSDTKPAYVSCTRVTHYQDGRKHGIDVDIFGSISYYFQGVLVPSKYVLRPHELTFDEIISHNNTEVRRIGCEIYGFDRMLEENKFSVLHQDVDKWGRDRFLLEAVLPTDEHINLVKVVDGTHNSEPEIQEYFMKVPPDVKDCQTAVAWTFRMTPEEYDPCVET